MQDDITDAARAAQTPAYPFLTFSLDEKHFGIDLRENEFPTIIRTFSGANLESPDASVIYDKPDGVDELTYYGLVIGGSIGLAADDSIEALGTESVTIQSILKSGSYFVQPAPIALFAESADSRVLLIGRCGYRGLRSTGGPVEPEGRLNYIDGCFDTLLVSPPIYGDPCLNQLEVPAGTNQTAHTHPSERIGLILDGAGYVMTPDGSGNLVRNELLPGMGWHIPTGLTHSFHTDPDKTMLLFAWHPDSTFGPAHNDHPMLRRSYVGGVSAVDLPEIHTAERTGTK